MKLIITWLEYDMAYGENTTDVMLSTLDNWIYIPTPLYTKVNFWSNHP